MKKTIITFVSTAALVISANAQNLLVNGDFSLGDFGWNTGTSGVGTGAATIVFDPSAFGAGGWRADANGGEPAFQLNGIPANDPDAYMFQTFNTIIGDTYEWSIDHVGHQAQGTQPNSFAVRVSAGSSEPDFSTAPIFTTQSERVNFTTSTGTFVATDTLTTIGFYGEHTPTDGSHNVDNASVRSLAIPEPSSTALLGFSALGFMLRRRR